MQSGWGPAAAPAVRAVTWIRRTAADVHPSAWLRVPAQVLPWGGGRAHDGRGYIGRPAWHSWAEDCLTPAAWAVRSYRFAHWLWIGGLPTLALIVSLPARIGSGADLHPQAVIGVRFKLAHGFGVVIGDTAVIGDDCVLLQGVTLGIRHIGEVEPIGVRVHPRLGNRVRVGAGAVLLGAITVGDGAQIGANTVVLIDVPAGATAVGVPARIIEARSLSGGAACPADPSAGWPYPPPPPLL